MKQSDFDDEDEYHDELARLGRFQVCNNLYKYIPEAKEAKAHLDHIMDLCGTPPKGMPVLIICGCENYLGISRTCDRYRPAKPARVHYLDTGKV